MSVLNKPFYLLQKFLGYLKMRRFNHIKSTSRIALTTKVYNSDNLIMDEYTNISANSIIMNLRAKFIMKRKSGAAFGLTVITGNHVTGVIGKYRRDISNSDKDILDPKKIEYDKDVVVEEDVWIASNVTLLSGTKVGRGSIIGSGSVVRGVIPPYSIVIGNPAKIIGFVFTPIEAEEHERLLYSPVERIPRETLDKNYSKYFLKRIKEITNYINL